MITKQQYQKCLKVVEEYENQQEQAKHKLELAKLDFPIGQFVRSKLNKDVKGVVYDYAIYNGDVQLKIVSNGINKKVMVRNAVKIG